MSRKQKLFNGYGKSLSWNDWAKSDKNIHGLPESTIRNRLLQERWSVEKALSLPIHNTVASDRKQKILDKLNSKDNIHNLTYTQVYCRLQNGFTLDEALALPIGTKRKKSTVQRIDDHEAACSPSKLFSWPQTERKIIELLRSRIQEKDDDVKWQKSELNIQINLMRKLTVESGDQPGKYTVSELLEYLTDNPNQLLDNLAE